MTSEASGVICRNFLTNLAIFLAALSAAILLGVPLRTLDSNQIGLIDYSWQLILHFAFANHLHFGRDMVFTHGPYGFLATDVFYPGTYVALVLIRSGIAVIFAWALWTIGSRLIQNRACLLIWLFAVILMVGQDTGVRFLICGVALLVAYFYAFKSVFSPQLVPLIPLLALLALTRFPLFVTGFLIISAIVIDQIIVKQRAIAAAVALGYGVCIGVCWRLAGQGAVDFWPFVRNTLAISQGHTEAMSAAGPVDDLFDFLIAVVPLALVLACAGWRTRRWRGLLPPAIVAVLLVLIFKDAFVRHDDQHALRAGRLVLILALIFVPAIAPLVREKMRAIACVGLLLVAGMSASSILTRHYSRSAARVYANSAAVIFRRLADVAHVGSLRARMLHQYEATAADLRSGNPLPPLEGTVDLYGDDQALLIANHLAYLPRPVMQSYTAYTPLLAKLNAHHLEGPDAPANLLVDPSAYVSDRFPTLSENASFPQMLARYEPGPSPVPSKYLLLVKRREPRTFSRTLISSSTLGFHEKLPVNPSPRGPTWLTVKVHPTFLWHLAEMFYKPPELWMEVQTHDGKTRSYRLIRSMAAEGFILSPVIESSQDFLGLYSQNPWQTRADAVEQITFFAQREIGNLPYFRHNIEVGFYSLDFAEH